MSFLGRRIAAVAMVCSLLCLGVAVGQDDDAKRKAAEREAKEQAMRQKAIEQMRQVSKAIKQCTQPMVDHGAPPQSQCFKTESEAGPPLNVAWDVVKGKTARAPYLGYADFDLPSSWAIEEEQPSERKVAKACNRNYPTESRTAALWAQAGLRAELGFANDSELPRSKVWHFRFEFDVGADHPELVKMLWTDDSSIEHPVSTDNTCWAKAAQSAWNGPQNTSTPTKSASR